MSERWHEHLFNDKTQKKLLDSVGDFIDCRRHITDVSMRRKTFSNFKVAQKCEKCSQIIVWSTFRLTIRIGSTHLEQKSIEQTACLVGKAYRQSSLHICLSVRSGCIPYPALSVRFVCHWTNKTYYQTLSVSFCERIRLWAKVHHSADCCRLSIGRECMHAPSESDSYYAFDWETKTK